MSDITDRFINLLGEIVKMQFCCSLVFPWGQRSVFPLCWAVISLGEGVPIFFCCAGLAGRGLLQLDWAGGCRGVFIRDMHNYQTTQCPQQLHNPKILFMMSIKKQPIQEIQLNP